MCIHVRLVYSISAFDFQLAERGLHQGDENLLTDGYYTTCLEVPATSCTPKYYQKVTLRRNFAMQDYVLINVDYDQYATTIDQMENGFFFGVSGEQENKIPLKECRVLLYNNYYMRQLLQCRCYGLTCDLYMYYSKVETYGPLRICEINFT